jgi:uncharacterized membrane protein (UPF0127 family)
MSFMKRKLFLIGLLCILAGGACLLLVHVHAKGMSDTANTVQSSGITYEVVTTQAAQEKGLGGRASIPDNYGMLFVFPTDGSPGFWMKDMLVPIDMIWLTDSGTIASITPSVSPNTYPTVFYPPTPIRYVLETRAGFAVEKNWIVGTQISLPQSVLLPSEK